MKTILFIAVFFLFSVNLYANSMQDRFKTMENELTKAKKDITQLSLDIDSLKETTHKRKNITTEEEIIFTSAIVEDSQYIDDVKENKIFKIFASAGYVNVNRESKGVEDIEINGDPIYMGEIGVILFPGLYDIAISYANIINGSSSERESQYIDIYVNTIKTNYGTIGFGYHNHIYNSIIKNNTGQNLVLDDVQDISNNSALVLQNGDTYSSQNYYERYMLSYLLPAMKYVPYGIGIKYAMENGSKAHPYKKDSTGERYAYTDVEQEGTRIAFGYYKTENELKNGFGISTLEVYRRDFDRSYVIWYGESTPFSYTGQLSKPALGASADVFFKSDMFYLGASLDYEEQTFTSRISDTEEYTTILAIFASIVY